MSRELAQFAAGNVRAARIHHRTVRARRHLRRRDGRHASPPAGKSSAARKRRGTVKHGKKKKRSCAARSRWRRTFADPRASIAAPRVWLCFKDREDKQGGGAAGPAGLRAAVWHAGRAYLRREVD